MIASDDLHGRQSCGTSCLLNWQQNLKMLHAAKVILFFNPLLHWLFLDHDIIVLFLDNIEKKNQEKFKLSFGCF